MPTHGALSVAGAIMFVLGALILFDPAGDAYQVSMPVAIGIAAGLALLLGFAMTRPSAQREFRPRWASRGWWVTRPWFAATGWCR